MFVPLDNLAEWKADVYKALRGQIDRRRFMRRGLESLAGLSMLGLLTRVFSGSRVLAEPPPPVGQKPVKTGTFFFPRLKFNVLDAEPQWDVYPIGDVILRRELARLTNINVSQEPVVVSLADFDSLRRYPFVFATSERHFRFPKNEENNLREFLLRGGFVLGDDCVLGKEGTLFFEDYVKMMDRIWPDNPMQRVPNDHEIYHCYFDFPNGIPFLQGKDLGGWASFDKLSGRILTFASPTDLHCGWVCRFFTPELNKQAIKMGINIIIYYLTN